MNFEHYKNPKKAQSVFNEYSEGCEDVEMLNRFEDIVNACEDFKSLDAKCGYLLEHYEANLRRL